MQIFGYYPMWMSIELLCKHVLIVMNKYNYW